MAFSVNNKIISTKLLYEIVQVLGKVRQDAILGKTPKVPKLENVYAAMRNKETSNWTNTQKENNNKGTKWCYN